MFEIKGKYTTAKVFTDNADDVTIGQILELCNQSFMKDIPVRIMPDCHAGAGCVIGTTFPLNNGMVVPNLVGVDIGCGMFVIKLGKIDIDLEKLDSVIHENIPSGFNIRNTAHPSTSEIDLSKLNCYGEVNIQRALLSIGTLGGGNHFIEVDVDDESNKYLVIHTGSRNLGKQVAEYWQNVAITHSAVEYGQEYSAVVEKHKLSGDFSNMNEELAEIEKLPKEALRYVAKMDFIRYVEDMHVCQRYAMMNRRAIATVIMAKMGFKAEGSFTTIHNYISEDGVLRKGAVSAKSGELLIIPINMRDGSIIGTGKGNLDWNESAPHGAGRLFGRGEAKRQLSLATFEDTMKGIYTTCVNQSTLDESPMAYKGMDEIVENTKDTIDIVKIIKPIYNFKASGD